jgi:hypothetical protein
MMGVLFQAGFQAFQEKERQRKSKGARKDIKKARQRITEAAVAEKRKVTAVPADTDSEAARRTRRKNASLLTRGFAEPKLSQPGLLGEV